ncbi:MAG: SH3 domain-containing protein [bacterium]|nr:SH3 domain-containing protein [bacterium]
MLNRKLMFIPLTAIVTILLSGIFLMSSPTPVQAQTFGTGPWASQYYNSPNFQNPISGATPSYTIINFTWGTGFPTDAGGIPVPGVPADNFSAQFTSSQSFTAGTYSFTMSADDAASLYINNVQVLAISTAGSQTAQVVLPGGAVTMRIDYTEFANSASLSLSWNTSTTGGGGTVATAGPTFTSAPPTATSLPAIPAGALTATVIRTSTLNVREAPSTGGRVLGRILRGQTYAILGRNEEATWFLIQLSGYTAWAYGYYLYVNGNEYNAPISSSTSLFGLAGMPDTGVRGLAESVMRLRQGPSVATEQIGRVTWGDQFPIVGRTADGYWLQIVWKGTVGWIYAPFVRFVAGDYNNLPIR